MYMHMMDRKISWLAVIVVCLFLPAPPAAGQQSQHKPCLKLKERIYSFDAVRQGDFYDVALRFEAGECVLGVIPGSSPLQASWHAEPAGGLQADEQSFVARPLPQDESHSREITLNLRVTASAEAESGKHIIQGILKYQAVELSGPREEQLTLALPVKVVPAIAIVHSRKVGDDALKWYQILLLIAIFPIAFLYYSANEC